MGCRAIPAEVGLMARNPKHDILLEPIGFGPKTSRNRFWQTSHCTGYGSERPGTQARFRAMKAEGGWGVVCTEFCSIHPETDEYPWHSARLWDQGDIINLGYMCDEVHRHQSLAGVQLWYNGMHSPCLETREVPRGPSGLPSNVFPVRSIYDAMADEPDIAATVNMYVLAAHRAEQAGFDIVEVSGSDSTLPMQFLERRYNRRTDRYGGSLANRSRFYIEVMAALKRAVVDALAVTTRFETDTINGEFRVQHHDEGLHFVELMHREGVCALWAVKSGDYGEWGAGAVVSNGGSRTTVGMVEGLRRGQCDIIGAARPSIADPFLPAKIAAGRLEDIRECIGCNLCVSRMQQQALLSCTQNPTSGEEYRRAWHPEHFDQTANPCSVLVVGAGPAGMECAMVLGKRGYTVHLRDCAPELGGHWRDVARYPRCSEFGRVISYRQSQLAKLRNVEVQLGVSPMTADEVLQYGADKVVIATGAHWSTVGLGAEVHRPIHGADASRASVLTPEQIMRGKEVPGERVVVLDGEGYFTGIAMAELLADRGKQVTLVTNMNDVAEFSKYTMELANNKRMLHQKHIRPLTNPWAPAFEPGRLALFYLYRDSAELYELEPGRWGRRSSNALVYLDCDALVLVTSRVPNGELYAQLKSRRAEWPKNAVQAVYRIGDCHAPRQILNAIFDGHRLAREFDSPHPQYPLPFIRERQVWGHETYPKRGDPRPRAEVD